MRRVLVWDLPVRLFHWLTAVLVLALYQTAESNNMEWHAWFGEALLALVLFRLIWGLLGSETARFSHFVSGPAEAISHLRQFFRPKVEHGIGHNAAGGWMVLGLLGLLLLQSLTGIFLNNDVADQGPLTQLVPAWAANMIDDAHSALWDILVAGIAVHLLAIAAYAAFKHDDLVSPMLTGRKELPESIPAPQMVSLWKALVALLASVAITAAVSSWL